MKNNIPHPRGWNRLQEPDHRLDALLAYLHQENDPELSVWAVTTLAEGLGLSISIHDEDSIKEADIRGQEWVQAVYQAGISHEDKLRIGKMVDRHIRDLMATIGEWESENKL